MREKFILPANRQSLREIARVIDHYAATVNLDATELHDVQVAVAEASTNAIVHGLHEDPERRFEFIIEALPDGLAVTLRENGTPFDVEDVVPADLTSALINRKIGGLGIHLMHELLDDVHFSIEPDGMKVVSMIKRVKGIA